MTLKKRLCWCMDHGNLTVADLARWLERPDPTVRGWIKEGGAVRGAPMDKEALLDALDQLEGAIKKKHGFPVPQMTPAERIKYLAERRCIVTTRAASPPETRRSTR